MSASQKLLQEQIEKDAPQRELSVATFMSGILAVCTLLALGLGPFIGWKLSISLGTFLGLLTLYYFGLRALVSPGAAAVLLPRRRRLDWLTALSMSASLQPDSNERKNPLTSTPELNTHETSQDQLSPMCTHVIKVKDITTRGGATVVIDFYGSDDFGGFAEDRGGVVRCDGIERHYGPGEKLRLAPGESVTLMPGDWHAFWG